MGIGDKITGALKSGVARLEATQKRLEPYEKEVYEKARGAVEEGGEYVKSKATQAYNAEKKAFPGQVKRAKKMTRAGAQKAWELSKEGAHKAYEFEKKAYPTQKKLAEQGYDFIKKGFGEAYGKEGMFGASSKIIRQGVGGGEDYDDEEDESPVMRKPRRTPRVPFDEPVEDGPRDYIGEYAEQYARQFERTVEGSGQRGERRREQTREAQTPMERYLKKYEEKNLRREQKFARHGL